MVNRWFKPKNNNDIKKIHTIHSLGVGCVFFAVLFIFTKLFSVSLCPFKNIFGISCFGCGMTRGFISILELDFKSAFKYNVLSVPIFICTVIYCICALADFFFCRNYITAIEKQLAKKYMFPIYIAILIISFILNNLS